jgi:hypothetical protein
MNTGSRSLDSSTWRESYEATLFEVDKTKLPERIAQAEKVTCPRKTQPARIGDLASLSGSGFLRQS